MKSVIDVLIEIALNQYIFFGSIYILTVLILVIYNSDISICLCSF